jgi:hypothetical protein
MPLIQSYRPRSFRERGVAPPFTTRLLLGARLRQAQEAGAPLEIVVPNPSGGRGVYILPWSSIGVLGRPTMHDVILGRALCDGIARHDGRLSPKLLADAVSQTALQGLAGPLAAQAAADAARAGLASTLETRFRLLVAVTQRIEGARPDLLPIAEDTRENIEQRGRDALQRIAEEIGQSPQHLMDAIEAMAAQYTDIGLGDACASARLPRLVQSMRDMQRDLIAWVQAEAGGSGANPVDETREANAVARAADLVARIAERQLAQAREAMAEPVAVLRRFAEPKTDATADIELVFWLVDGWEGICRLWLAAPSAMPRNLALADMARSLPPLPDEAEAWLGLPTGTAEQLERTINPPRPRDRRLPIDQVAAAEKLHAIAL